MPDGRDKPEDERDEQAFADYEHLVSLCDKGMLYEAEDWLRAGHRATIPGDSCRCALLSAVRRGFHSLVRLLLRYGCTEEQLFKALEDAAKEGNFEICKLLVEAGAPVERLPYWHLDGIVNRPLIEYLLDHGLDLSREDGLAHMIVYRRIKPLLGILIGNKSRFPEWEEQAAKALCTFVEKRDLKWVCLMIWAKADPWMRVHELDEPDWRANDEDMKRNAVERAVQNENMEIYKALRVSPTPEQATALLSSVWFGPSKEMLKMLIEAGADLNAPDPERGSVLHRFLHSFAWRSSGHFRDRNPREEVEMIAWLIRQGAKWQAPDDDRRLDSLRRELYRADGELVVEAIRLLEAGGACGLELLRELADKPKMRVWIARHDERLFDILFRQAEAQAEPKKGR